jgi:hypothetical protein
MKTTIELKSVLCGLALGVLGMLALGAGGTSDSSGRYQVAGGAGTFTIIDTFTGQAWGANLTSFQAIQPGFWDKKYDK